MRYMSSISFAGTRWFCPRGAIHAIHEFAWNGCLLRCLIRCSVRRTLQADTDLGSMDWWRKTRIRFCFIDNYIRCFLVVRLISSTGFYEKLEPAFLQHVLIGRVEHQPYMKQDIKHDMKHETWSRWLIIWSMKHDKKQDVNVCECMRSQGTQLRLN